MLHIFSNRNAIKAQLNKCDRHDGFTVIELIIVLAIMAILMFLVSVGLEGYTEAADRIERNEVAESSYYALQSYLAVAKRQGELEEFTESVKNYNQSQFGDNLVLREDENRIIIESNYEGSDFASYYTSDYLVQHEESEIICMKLDAGEGVVRKSNPLYTILFAALKDEDVMKHSFMVEYDSSSGIVRSVIYSKHVDSLEYHFAEAEETRIENIADVIERNAVSLDKKRQGYCGVLETAGIREKSPLALVAPDDLEIINGDRLYVTWSEANLTDPLFMNGIYDINGIRYVLKLFDQDNAIVAEYVLDREDIWKDTIGTGTVAEALDALDDSAETIESQSRLQITRASGNGFTMENSMSGVAEDRYFVILECLDHTFATQGYDLDGEKELYAIVSVEYPGEDVEELESKVSNVESAYFASVSSEGEGEDADYTYEINCSRHLYNMRQGMADGEYQIVENIHWNNIENRARNILFDPVEYASREYIGFVNQYTGTLRGNGHTVSGLRILDDESVDVGLLATSNGNVTGVIFESANVTGDDYVGLIAGRNYGTIDNVVVRNSIIEGKERIGGLSGENSGIVQDSTVAGTDVSGERYIGGVVGFQQAGGTMYKIEAGTDSNPGIISGVLNVGGAVGGSMGSLDTINNYNTYAVEVPDNRADFGGNNTYIHSNFGGIAGAVEAGVATKCINMKPISLAVYDESRQLSTLETAAYIGNVYNMPQYVGGVAGGNVGTLRNSYSKVADANIYDPDGSITITTGKRDLVELYQGTWTNVVGTYAGSAGIINVGGFAKDGFVAELSAVGSDMWCAQSSLQYLDYEAGKTYILRCAMTSDVNKNVFVKVQGDNHSEIAIETVSLQAGQTYNLEKEVYIPGDYNGEVSLYFAYGGNVQGDTISPTSGMTLKVENVEFYSETQIEIETRNYEVGINEYVSKKDTGVFLGDYVGGVAGNNSGTIEFDNGFFTDNTLLVDVEGNSYVGGVAGLNNGSIAAPALVVEGDVFANNNDAGGAVALYAAGNIPATITNRALVIGESAGGIISTVATADLTLNNCVNEGAVFARGDGDNVLSGGGIVANNIGIITNCTNRGIVTSDLAYDRTTVLVPHGNVNIGGVAGSNYGTVQNCHSVSTGSNYLSGNYHVGGLVGENISSDTTVARIVTDYTENVNVPIFANAYTAYQTQNSIGGIVGSASGTMELAKFQYSGQIISQNNHAIGEYGAGCAIGGIVGNTGKNNVINSCVFVGNISTTGNRVGGLIGYIGETGNRITQSSVSKAATIEGHDFVGGLVGVCYAEDIQIDTQLFETPIRGNNYVGGYMGYTRSLNELARENRAEIIGREHVGGFVGYFRVQGKQSNLVNIGMVKGTGNNIGGIAGTINGANATFEGMRNSAVIEGTEVVGGIFGNVDNDCNIVLVNCRNTTEGVEDISIKCAIENAGGIIGRTASGSSYVTVQNCYNNMDILGINDKLYRAGGIVGFGNCAKLTITGSENQGNLGKSNVGTIERVGGIIGHCAKDFKEEVLIENCVSEGNFYRIANSSGVGGIVGYSETGLKIIGSRNGAEGTQKGQLVLLEGTRRNGGLVGSQSGKLTIENSSNYGSLVADSKIEDAGGILGYNSGELFIGRAQKTDNVYGARNYGTFRTTNGSEVRNVGGIVGKARNTMTIYDCENHGAFAPDESGLLFSAGGVVGYAEYDNASYAPSFIARSIQNGNFYHAKGDGISSGAGGVAGFAKIPMTISDCENNGTIYTVDGSERNGGIVAANFAVVTVKDCTNNGDIIGTGNTNDAGGILGLGWDTFTVTGCVNNGTMNAGTRGERIGGITGCNRALLKADACTNYGEITANEIHAAAGIIGQLDHTGEEINTISNCTQLGNINNIKGVDSSAGAGGIIGFNKANTTISKCYNGSEGDGNTGQFKALPGAIRIGGIVGTNYNLELKVEDCVSYGNITCDGGLTDSGGVIGVVNRDSGEGRLIYISNSVNNGAISAAGNSYRLGGIVGDARVPLNASQSTNKGTIYVAGYAEDVAGAIGSQNNVTELTDIENQGAITVAGNGLRVSGLIGYNTAELTADSCSNRGDITFNGTAQESGGGIGRQNGAANLRTVNNYGAVHMSGNGNFIGGLVGFCGNKLDMNACVNEGAITTQSNLYFGSGIIGSMVGDFTTTLYRVENKGVITATQFAENIGGIIGDFYAPRVVYIDRCINHAPFTARTTIINYGGIIGKHAGTSYFGTAADVPGQELNFGAKNFGGITSAAGGTINNTSGIIGNMISTTYIHEGECYGEIKLNGGAINNAGGVIGYCEGNGDVTIKSTGQFSNITGTSNIGGLIGADIHTGKMVLENSYVVGLQGGAAGQDITIGALIGNKRDVTNLIIINSYGNTFITQGNKIMGGRDGVNDLTPGNTCFNGGTQGYIDQRIAGADLASIYNRLCATYGLVANYTDVYNSYRQLMRYYPENPNYPGYPAFMQ